MSEHGPAIMMCDVLIAVSAHSLREGGPSKPKLKPKRKGRADRSVSPTRKLRRKRRRKRRPLQQAGEKQARLSRGSATPKTAAIGEEEGSPFSEKITLRERVKLTETL